MKKVMVVFGTRPEAIKMCPLVNELKSRPGLETIVCVTGQHRQMLDQVLETFAVVPDHDLAIMKNGQTLFDITDAILNKIREILERLRPDVVLVHGDTSTTFAMSRYYFAPTVRSREYLLRERKDGAKVWVTGNTVIDALRTTVQKGFAHPELDWALGSRLIFITAHRRENLGGPMHHMFRAIHRIVREYPDVKALYPIHMNPTIRRIAEEELGDLERVHIIEPVDVIECHNLMARSYLILTDSGGIQEEAPSLGKPVLVMRDTTERPEGVEAGTLKLVGTDEEVIHRELKILLDDKEAYDIMAKTDNPYGDGHACARIADILEHELLKGI